MLTESLIIQPQPTIGTETENKGDGSSLYKTWEI